MLNAGAKANDLDYFENAALHLAASVGEIEIGQILLKHGEYQGNSVGGTMEIGGSDKGDNTMPNGSVLFENTRLREMVSAEEPTSISKFPDANN